MEFSVNTKESDDPSSIIKVRLLFRELVAGDVNAPFGVFFHEGEGDGFTTGASVFVEALEEEFGSCLGDSILFVEFIVYADFCSLTGGIPPIEGGTSVFEGVLVSFGKGGFPSFAVAFHGSVVVSLTDLVGRCTFWNLWHSDNL
jgi:hypothetical protein